MIAAWFDLTASVAGFIFPLLCLFEGSRQWSAFGRSRGVVLLSLFGLIFILVHVVYSYRLHQFQEEALAILAKGVDIPELTESWGKDLTPEERTSGSTELARAAFRDHGHLQHIFSESGEQKLFVPTAKDLQDREERVAGLAKLEASAESTALVPARITITAVLVALLGFGFGRTKKVANPPLNPDAPTSGAPVS